LIQIINHRRPAFAGIASCIPKIRLGLLGRKEVQAGPGFGSGEESIYC